jgi:hypothetical protein
VGALKAGITLSHGMDSSRQVYEQMDEIWNTTEKTVSVTKGYGDCMKKFIQNMRQTVAFGEHPININYHYLHYCHHLCSMKE